MNIVILCGSTRVTHAVLCPQRQGCLVQGVVLQRHKTMLCPHNSTLPGPACFAEAHSYYLRFHRYHSCLQAPCLIERNNKFYLFYSGNDYGPQHYAVGAPIAQQATGED